MAKAIWENGRPKLIYGDSEDEDDWIKRADPKAAKEEIEIHEELEKENADEE